MERGLLDRRMKKLVYDSGCPYCTGIAKLASSLSDIEIQSYQSDEARELLDETFEDPGFTLYLFEEDTVYWGSEAAERISEHLGIPGVLRPAVVGTYPHLVKLFSILSGRSGVRQPVCDNERCYHNSETGGSKPLQEQE